ncbi:MAG: restriction endonuclease [Verrucomicrobiota bacterium]
MSHLKIALGFAARIAESGLSIYDEIEIGSEFWIPSDSLELLLQLELVGHRFESAALRTRSKLAKEKVCLALGYPVPKSFKKTRPRARFPGQNFDTYVQGANNLQIWNEELSPSRRYVLIRPDFEGVVQRVRVVCGADLAPLDTTGKLTRKFQARVANLSKVSLASGVDTPNLMPAIASSTVALEKMSPINYPAAASLLPIRQLFDLLKPLIGRSFEDPGILQERNRGGRLHGMVATALGYSTHADNGKFPDIRQQVLEVKLQTSPTIDLGAISPDSEESLDFPSLGRVHIRHQDVRYAVFCGSVSGAQVTVNGLILVTGLEFFSVFEQFGGLVVNKKYQMHLPNDFFDKNTEGLFD